MVRRRRPGARRAALLSALLLARKCGAPEADPLRAARPAVAGGHGALRASPGRAAFGSRRGRRPWIGDDLEHLAMLQAGLHRPRRACRSGAASLPVRRGLERDLDALLDAAASLGDEYTRSASLGQHPRSLRPGRPLRAGPKPRQMGDRRHGPGPARGGPESRAIPSPGRPGPPAPAHGHAGFGRDRSTLTIAKFRRVNS